MRIDKRYYENSDGIFNFMPAIHRPGGSRALHDDFLPGFRWIPRTYTSFIFVDAYVIEGSTTHWFAWKGRRYSKAWPNPGESYKALITFRDPISMKSFDVIYSTWPIWNNLQARIGPRVSDELENAEPTVYVNWLRGPKILTFGTKKLKEYK